jgi:hypothetical protein
MNRLQQYSDYSDERLKKRKKIKKQQAQLSAGHQVMPRREMLRVLRWQRDLMTLVP